MHVYKWDTSLLTEHRNVDNDNLQIVRKAQALCNLIEQQADQDRIIEVAKLLENIVFSHFEQEEMMQLYSNFGNYTAHKRHHAKLLKAFTSLIHQVIEEPYNMTHVARMDSLIQDQYFNHIREFDTEAAKYIMQRDYYHN